MPPSVVYIAFPFPPSRGAGVYRTVGTANHLTEAGWHVTVVAPEVDYFIRYQGSEDRSLISWVNPEVEVRRVRLSNWLRETQVSRMSFARVLRPTTYRREVTRLQRYLSPLDHYPFWLFPSLRATIAEGRRRRADVILATGNPFNSFVAAARAAKKLDIPYVLDYRDSWTFDQFTDHLKPLASDLAISIERRLLHGAGAYVSVNSAILDWLTTTHFVPDSVPRCVIPNGYDPEFVKPPIQSMKRDSSHRFSYVHVGTLVPEKMNWHGMLGQFDRSAQELENEVNLVLTFFGHLGFSSAQGSDLRAMFDKSSHVSYAGSVPKSDVGDIYASADVLFLPMYESRFVTSGKVYEMMATNKPILAWGPDDAGALEPLRGYPKLVRADPARRNSLTRAMRIANGLASIQSPELDVRTRDYSLRFSRGKSLEPLDPLLRSVIR